MPGPTDTLDWTGGPAKWAAVAVLGGASIIGMAWSIFGREAPRPAVVAAAPATITSDAAPPPAPASIVRIININTAPAAELELLPGIGPALAARIVEHRSKIGRFTGLGDLDNVSGIGPMTLEKLRPLVRFE